MSQGKELCDTCNSESILPSVNAWANTISLQEHKSDHFLSHT